MHNRRASMGNVPKIVGPNFADRRRRPTPPLPPRARRPREETNEHERGCGLSSLADDEQHAHTEPFQTVPCSVAAPHGRARPVHAANRAQSTQATLAIKKKVVGAACAKGPSVGVDR